MMMTSGVKAEIEALAPTAAALCDAYLPAKIIQADYLGQKELELHCIKKLLTKFKVLIAKYENELVFVKLAPSSETN